MIVDHDGFRTIVLDVPAAQFQSFFAFYLDVLAVESFLLGMPVPHGILAITPTSHIYLKRQILGYTTNL
jgi:hypothetical protein